MHDSRRQQVKHKRLIANLNRVARIVPTLITRHDVEALRKQIDRSTPYRNAPKERADTIISGEVLEWREATLGRGFESDYPRETAATLIIRFRWQDMRTGSSGAVSRPTLRRC